MTDNIIERAKVLRAMIENLASENIEDKDAQDYRELFPKWKTETAYTTGDKVNYGGIIYKCLQAHTSQETWTPDAAVSLWAKVLNPDPEVIPEWEQPDSTNPYMKGDKVRFEGHIYESTIDNNVWSPTAYPAGWKQID